VRIVIADDERLLRDGLSLLLREFDVDVVATVGDGPALLRAVAINQPDVAVVDIKMPPTHTDEGLGAAAKIREEHPGVGVLLLSHYLDARYAVELMEQHPGGVGYLLKERVSDVAVLVDALHRVAVDECVVDPTIVAQLVRRQRADDPLQRLSGREREVLTLMAEGRSNHAIAESLSLSPKTVERHIGHIFEKLTIDQSEDWHRRVVAVLKVLRSS
jgi:DNA-binding NarL/FixJ family response regulator